MFISSNENHQQNGKYRLQQGTFHARKDIEVRNAYVHVQADNLKSKSGGISERERESVCVRVHVCMCVCVCVIEVYL